MRAMWLTLVLVACGDDGPSIMTTDAPPGGGDGSISAPLFEEPVRLPIRAVGAAVRDLDGDGIDDLVLTITRSSQDPSTVVVRAGKRDRTFADAGAYFTGSQPSTITFADANNDQIPDAVLGEALGDIVTVLPGVAGGTFGAELSSQAAASTTNLVAGTFDGDTEIDIVTGPHRTTMNAAVILGGSGDGTFVAPTTIPLGSPIDVGSLLAADFEKDGNLDIAVADFLDDLVVIYKGAGDGTFAERSRLTILNASDLRTGDLDGNGTLDLVVLPAGKVVVAKGNGDGTFGAPTDFPARTAFNNMELADVDGDGKLDVMAADNISDSFHVLLGLGDGSLAAPFTFPIDGVDDFAVGDFDDDGQPDLVVLTPMTSEVLVYFGRG